MKPTKAIFINAWPYQKDTMNLPVNNVESAIPFYQSVMGFEVASTKDTKYKSVVLQRDAIQIGLSENGGDPSQDGCFFEVDDVTLALEEMKSNGLNQETELKVQKHGEVEWSVYFVIAPDELCYCIGQKH